MTARPIGEIFQAVLDRAETMMKFQEMLRAEQEAGDRKSMIMTAHFDGLLTDDETEILIDIYELRGA